jgi:hypothetical protein
MRIRFGRDENLGGGEIWERFFVWGAAFPRA